MQGDVCIFKPSLPRPAQRAQHTCSKGEQSVSLLETAAHSLVSRALCVKLQNIAIVYVPFDASTKTRRHPVWSWRQACKSYTVFNSS